VTPPTSTTGTPTTVLVPPSPPAGTTLAVTAALRALERLRWPGAGRTSRGHILASPQGWVGSGGKNRLGRPYGGQVTVTSAQLLSGFPAQGGPGGALGGEGAAGARGARSATDRLRPTDRPASSLAITLPAGERLIDGQGVISIGSRWDGGSMDASTSQRVPFALGGLILIFVFVQWLIDRRDPKLVEAPASRHEDSIGFE
jgi:hypothetical protein